MVINAERSIRDVVVVAASSGAYDSVQTIAAAFPPEVPAGIAVVLHRGVHDDPGRLASILQDRSRLRVVEPNDGEPFEHGVLYLAPMDRHLVLHGGRFYQDEGPKEHFTRPAADPLFRSAAADFGPRVLAVVLSGYDGDGAMGANAVNAGGGITLVQAPWEADVAAMPLNTIRIDHVGAALPLDKLVEAIPILARGEAMTVE